ncbi:PAS domain-containing protein [Magnetospirillum sp. SS-4]|uniref:PAS domain-containing protein n=1 Tax=Magnetospirillum sp. SS-4 TaxID=2681465 RepID=UPI001380FC12|nr:PAS domain-containing protein [Magnetospirillum sp. SS-4]CAA7627561.1 putative PAS/PAC sensor protein [Magnetospirillum sp. SS-4]
MRDRTWIALTFFGLALAAAAAPFAAVWWLGQPAGTSQAVPSLVAAALLAFAWWRVDRLILEPGGRLAEALETWLRTPALDHPLHSQPKLALDGLPDAIRHLADAACQQRRGLRQVSRQAAEQAEEQRNWLDVALRHLAESVVVCDTRHRILFHNAAAVRLLGNLAEGHCLSIQVPRAALDHALDCLRARLDALGGRLGGDVGTALFSCLIRQGHRVAHGQMSLVQVPRHGVTGYVAVFRDVSEDWADSAPHDAVAVALTRDLRGPLGALDAAAQMLGEYPDMERTDRARFIKVIGEECARLRHRVDSLADGRVRPSRTAWPMADLHFTELFACVSASLRQRLDINLTMVGVPLWLHGDSQSLMEAFLALFAALHIHTGRSDFDMECLLGDRQVYVDINWKGDPIPDGRLGAWLEGGVSTQLGPQTVRDVLERHGSQPWSLAKRGGFAALRLPLPPSRRPQFTEEEWTGLGSPPSLTEADRREELLRRSTVGAFAGRALDRMPFVAVCAVLPPGAVQSGDRRRITALGAVRIEDGRLLTAGSFERRISATVAGSDGRPPLPVVLPQFWTFAGDAVLVAHDIGPCLGLLEEREAAGTIPPVLDTMELSRLLDPDADDHGLEAVARRLGLRVGDHRTEIGKALLAAEILLRQIEHLRELGIVRFDQLIEAVRSQPSRTGAPVEG